MFKLRAICIASLKVQPVAPIAPLKVRGSDSDLVLDERDAELEEERDAELEESDAESEESESYKILMAWSAHAGPEWRNR